MAQGLKDFKPSWWSSRLPDHEISKNSGQLPNVFNCSHIAASILAHFQRRAEYGRVKWGQKIHKVAFKIHFSKSKISWWIKSSGFKKRGWIIVKIQREVVKFIYSEKVTKFCEIFTLLLPTVHTDKSKVNILQNYVAFSE